MGRELQKKSRFAKEQITYTCISRCNEQTRYAKPVVEVLCHLFQTTDVWDGELEAAYLY